MRKRRNGRRCDGGFERGRLRYLCKSCCCRDLLQSKQHLQQGRLLKVEKDEEGVGEGVNDGELAADERCFRKDFIADNACDKV
jgi:hypothetical protein